MEDSENIKKLKELLSNGYKLKQRTTHLMANPNNNSPLEIVLVKGDDKQKMVFGDKDADQANLIIDLNS